MSICQWWFDPSEVGEEGRGWKRLPRRKLQQLDRPAVASSAEPGLCIFSVALTFSSSFIRRLSHRPSDNQKSRAVQGSPARKMHAFTLLLTAFVAVITALQRDAVLDFEGLDYGDEDIYAARPVGLYKGLNFRSNFGGEGCLLQ